MNIGLFTDMYYPRISGVVTSARILEQQLAKQNHKVYIFTTTDPKAPHFESNVYRLPSVPLFFLKDTHRMAYFYPPYLINKIRKLKLDIVHTYTEFGIGFFGKLVSKMYNIPMVHTYHTMYEDYIHYVANGKIISRKGAQKFSKIFCNRADVVIAPTDATGEYLHNIGVKKPIYTIPTGLDFSPFSPNRFSTSELNKARKEFKFTNDDKIIAVVGRLAKEKSVDVLINAMPSVLSQVPTAKMLIVGDGPIKSDLQNQARNLGIEKAVHFAGMKPWADVGKYYVISDVFVTASTSETQGLTYAEAMAARIPVVVKRDIAFERLVKHGETGFIFEQDHEAADTLVYALSNPEISQRVALNAFAAVQPMSAEVFGVEMEAVYRKIMKNS